MQERSYYPQSPELKDRSFLKPSGKFRQSVVLVILAILLFVFLYLLLLSISILAVIGCTYAGISLIIFKPHWITIIIGGGLIAFSLMILAFLVKFIFSVKKPPDNHHIELKQTDHPKLFDFLSRLTKETGTRFPKKVFLRPEVNASVTYNSSFLSLFLPVRKNLQIGAGLLNSISINEFKAVLAHEFGHFSQKSMTLGSYIYIVNSAIYNMVYEYDGWDRTLEKWAGMGGLASIMVFPTSWMVNGMRYLFRKAYSLINLQYRRLSREMEFHADLVAVSVTGKQALINALRRLDFGNAAYDFTLTELEKLAEQKKRPQNLYLVQSRLAGYMCRFNELREENGLPVITDKVLKKYTAQSRVRYKDRWATHPEQAEREANINKTNLDSTKDTRSPWILFESPEQVQTTLTETIYANGYQDQQFELSNEDEIADKIIDHDISIMKPKIFEGYFDSRLPATIPVKELKQDLKANSGSFIKFFSSSETKERLRKIRMDQQDLQLLAGIGRREIPIKYFEFDGKKYSHYRVASLYPKLEQEVSVQKKQLDQADITVWEASYGLSVKAGREEEFLSHYKHLYDLNVLDNMVNQVTETASELYQTLYSRPSWTEDGLLIFMNKVVALRKKLVKREELIRSVNVPMQIGSIELKDGLFAYLLGKKIIDFQHNRFNEDTFLRFIQQINRLSNNYYELMNESLIVVLKFVDELIRPEES